MVRSWRKTGPYCRPAACRPWYTATVSLGVGQAARMASAERVCFSARTLGRASNREITAASLPRRCSMPVAAAAEVLALDPAADGMPRAEADLMEMSPVTSSTSALSSTDADSLTAGSRNGAAIAAPVSAIADPACFNRVRPAAMTISQYAAPGMTVADCTWWSHKNANPGLLSGTQKLSCCLACTARQGCMSSDANVRVRAATARQTLLMGPSSGCCATRTSVKQRRLRSHETGARLVAAAVTRA